MALRAGAVGGAEAAGEGGAEPALKKRRRRPLELEERQPGQVAVVAPARAGRKACGRGGKAEQKKACSSAAPGKGGALGRKGRVSGSVSEKTRQRAAGHGLSEQELQIAEVRWEAADRLEMLETPAGRMALSAGLLRVRGKNGRLVALEANPAQRFFEERRGAEDVVLKARQMGMSTWIAGQFLLRTLLVPGTVTLQVAHTREAAMGLFRIVHRMWLHLDPELRADVWKLGRRSKTEMTFPAIDSEFRIASAGEENAGRGLTVTNLHLSEVARWQGDAAETLAGLRASLAPQGQLVMESTPNGAYGCFFKEWQTAERRGAVRHFFPWWMEPGYRAAAAAELTDEEMALVAAHGLVPEQIGYRRQLRERFGGMAAQEFAEDAVSCFRESGSCFFEAKDVAARLLLVTSPVERRWNGALEVWLPAVSGRTYLLAADPAGGTAEGDWSAAQVVDLATGRQCAELQARWAPRMFAQRIAELAREYGGALVVVERNNHGAGVLAFLEGETGVRVYAGSDGQGGFLTTVQSRAAMLAELGVLLSNRAELFASERLLGECRTFVMKDGGRTEAAAGSHDDLVLAMAIAQAVRRETVGRG